VTILVLGSHGQLGKSLCHELKHKNISHVSLSKLELDITNYDAVKNIITDLLATVIINTAAYTNVDGAEDNPEIAYAVNVEGPKNIALVCNSLDIPLIHISTDYVFDGMSNQPYHPDSPVNPLSVYGKTKQSGEEAIQRSCRHYIILRTSWLFSIYGKNFLTTMIDLSKERDIISVVTNQIGCPTNADHLSQVIVDSIKLIQNLEFESGIYHYADKEACSWYAFATEIFKIINADYTGMSTVLKPIIGSDFPAIAQRPSYSALDSQKFCSTFNQPHLSWKDGLNKMIASYLHRSES
jgi:dTDP-4-dehydrorhamnose reductase